MQLKIKDPLTNTRLRDVMQKTEEEWKRSVEE